MPTALKVKKTTWLNEVSYIRPIAIILVVIYHSFAIYTGSWSTPQNLVHVELYDWIPYFLTSFRMPAIILIAGYVFAFQQDEKQRYESIKPLAREKLHRLIIPSIFFSILYILLPLRGQWINLADIPERLDIIKILNGVSHIWFLPMLFWNFLLGYFLMKLKYNSKFILFILFIVSVIAPVIVIPFLSSITNALTFIFFFYLGISLWRKRQYIVYFLEVPSNIFYFCIGFIMCFLVFTYLDRFLLYNEGGFLIKGILRFLKYILYTYGVLSFYLIVMFFTEIKKVEPSSKIKDLSKYSYGIYIFHQFILMYIIYNVKLSDYIHTLILPWALFLIAISSSYLLTRLTLKTKVGRFLIG